LVNLLLDKIKPIEELDLSKAKYENFEAIGRKNLFIVLKSVFF